MPWEPVKYLLDTQRQETPETLQVITGQAEAIARICAWLDTWRQYHPSGPWWPEVLTREDLRRGRPTQGGPARPSWCYGTPGLARTQQLAGLATGDTARRRMAEQAMAGCLSDPRQLDRLTDHGLCHGTAGVFQTAWRGAAEATTIALADRLSSSGTDDTAEPDGFLRGAAGRTLALSTAAIDEPPTGGWGTYCS